MVEYGKHKNIYFILRIYSIDPENIKHPPSGAQALQMELG